MSESESRMSHVSATIPWQEGTEEDFKDLHEHLARLQQFGGGRLDDEDSDDTSDEDDEDPGAGAEPGVRLLWAAQHNHLDLVEQILDCDPGLVDYQDTDGYRALHRAAYSHHTEVLSK